jgi:phosphotransferase system enzyme I (PtsI)
MKNPGIRKRRPKKFKGIPASPGIAYGDISIFTGKRLVIQDYSLRIQDIDAEIKRLRETVALVADELEEIKVIAEKQYGKNISEIFDAQITLLKDKYFFNEIEKAIMDQRKNAEYIVYRMFKEKQEYFSKQENEYFRDRALDLQALKRQIIAKLQGEKETQILNKVSVVVAPDLSPRDTVSFDRRKTLGFAIDKGGITSHTAILARSLEIPCVVGLSNFSTFVKEGDKIILDGSEGVVYLNPPAEIVNKYLKRKEEFEKLETNLLHEAHKPVRTTCGIDVKLLANLELKDESQAVKHVGAKGIGLLRTEGLFIEQGKIPDEDTQVNLYCKIAKDLYPLPISIRTIDIGGDKTISQISFPPESNPFLGWRAVRFCLDTPLIFKEQLRAILRTSGCHDNVKIMLPFITTIEEIRESKKLLEECKTELKAEGAEFNSDIEVGIMIETPAAALMVNIFAGEVDFISIGTNDLTQYTLAVDRGNERIAKLYSHFYPAVLQLIQRIIKDGNSNSVEVSMCGEMAGDPIATVLLLGLGLRNFSAAPIMLPTIAGIIRETSIEEAEKIAGKILAMASSKEAEAYLKKYMQKKYSHILF